MHTLGGGDFYLAAMNLLSYCQGRVQAHATAKFARCFIWMHGHMDAAIQLNFRAVSCI